MSPVRRAWSDRVEFVAIPLVVVILGIFVILAAAAFAGLWAWLLVGALGLAACAGLAWFAAERHRHPAAGAAPATGPAAADPAAYRVLVVAAAGCPPEALGERLSEQAAGRTAEAFVIAPAVGSRLARWTGDEAAYAEATRHLDETLGALAEIGVGAHGHIGSHDPIQAADDALREFPADAIVFAIHSGGSAYWLEGDAVEVARSRYGIPVTQIVADAAGSTRG